MIVRLSPNRTRLRTSGFCSPPSITIILCLLSFVLVAFTHVPHQTPTSPHTFTHQHRISTDAPRVPEQSVGRSAEEGIGDSACRRTGRASAGGDIFAPGARSSRKDRKDAYAERKRRGASHLRSSVRHALDEMHNFSFEPHHRKEGSVKLKHRSEDVLRRFSSRTSENGSAR